MPLLDVLSSSELPAGVPRAVDVEGRAIALVRLGDEIHAIDDLCPQDGAPLVGGELVGTALRCEKHGGRFDVTTGQSLRGGEDVRRYHVREEQGRILVQVDTPLPELEQGRIVASMRAALIQADGPRLARDCVRLLEANADPTDVVRAAVRYGAERGAGGFHSSLAACADFARITPLYEGYEQAIPLTQALLAVANANRGRPQRAIPEQARGVLMGSAETRRRLFVKLVEERRAEEAEAMLSGALWQGLAASEAQQWLLSVACAHVIDGGTTLNHTVKALDLCDLLSMREAIYLLPPLVPPHVYGIREERTGPLRQAAELLHGYGGGLESLASRGNAEVGRTFQDRAIRTMLLEGTPTGAFEAVLGALQAGVPPVRVGLAIVFAAVERALRFDELLEWDDTSEASWEEALRPFVYAVAATRAVERWASAETVRALVLAAARVQAARAFESDERRRPHLRTLPVSPREPEAIAAVTSAVRTLRGSEAMALARGCVERGHNPWKLFEALARYVVEDNLVAQSQVEQAAAVVIAAVDAWEIAGEHPDAAMPLYLAVKFLSSESRQRWSRRSVMQAIERVKR